MWVTWRPNPPASLGKYPTQRGQPPEPCPAQEGSEWERRWRQCVSAPHSSAHELKGSVEVCCCVRARLCLFHVLNDSFLTYQVFIAHRNPEMKVLPTCKSHKWQNLVRVAGARRALKLACVSVRLKPRSLRLSFSGLVLSGEWVTLGDHCDHCVVSWRRAIEHNKKECFKDTLQHNQNHATGSDG